MHPATASAASPSSGALTGREEGATDSARLPDTASCSPRSHREAASVLTDALARARIGSASVGFSAAAAGREGRLGGTHGAAWERRHFLLVLQHALGAAARGLPAGEEGPGGGALDVARGAGATHGGRARLPEPRSEPGSGRGLEVVEGGRGIVAIGGGGRDARRRSLGSGFLAASPTEGATRALLWQIVQQGLGEGSRESE